MAVDADEPVTSFDDMDEEAKNLVSDLGHTLSCCRFPLRFTNDRSQPAKPTLLDWILRNNLCYWIFDKQSSHDCPQAVVFSFQTWSY